MCKPAQIRTLVADTAKEMTAACDDCLSGFPADSLLRFSFSEAERKACIRRYYITAAKLTDLLHHCDAYVAGLSPALEAADAPGRLAQFDEIYRWMEQYWHFREHLISLLAEAHVDQTTIKKIVGHSGAMSLTERIYTHLDVPALVEAINQI